MNYTQEIDIFVPQAVKIANAKIKEADYDDLIEYSDAWNKVYHDALAKILAEKCIRYTRKYPRTSKKERIFSK